MSILLSIFLALSTGPVASPSPRPPSSAPSVAQIKDEPVATEAKGELVAVLPDKSRLLLFPDTLQHMENHIYQMDYAIDFLMVPNWDVNITSVRGNLQVDCDKNIARMINNATYTDEKTYLPVPDDSGMTQWRPLTRSDNDLGIYKRICKVDMVD